MFLENPALVNIDNADVMINDELTWHIILTSLNIHMSLLEPTLILEFSDILQQISFFGPFTEVIYIFYLHTS